MGSASFYREVIARNAVVQGEFAVLHSGAVDASFRSRPVPAQCRSLAGSRCFEAGQVMSDQPQHPGRPDSDDIAGSRLVPQVGMMLKAFWASPVRNTLLWLAGVIFLVVVSTAYGQIRLNRW